jgi:hypothetical protein
MPCMSCSWQLFRAGQQGRRNSIMENETWFMC